MYEQFGIEGLKAFKKTVDYCHEKDMVVIGDSLLCWIFVIWLILSFLL